MPSPTTATSSLMPGSAARKAKVTTPSRPGTRDERELHLHPDRQPCGVGLGQPGFHAHLRRPARRSPRRTGSNSSPSPPEYGGDLGRKRWTVHVQSVPRRASRRSPTSPDVQRGQASWRGNVTVPQRGHSEPRRTGSAAVPASRSRCMRGRGEADGGRAANHVAVHPPVGVEVRDREECADEAAVVPPRLAERELGVAVGGRPDDVVRPPVHVAGVDEGAQLRLAAAQLRRLAVVVVGPFDRELDLVRDEVERRVRCGPSRTRSSARRRSCRGACSSSPAGGTPTIAKVSSV